ncbi:hypothetical protein BT69DRAFT_1130867 [Atractiella rhizophila]|nr:hypothetical protein BT69DRAFT_1130867 [Atractiella rhizophila]
MKERLEKNLREEEESEVPMRKKLRSNKWTSGIEGVTAVEPPPVPVEKEAMVPTELAAIQAPSSSSPALFSLTNDRPDPSSLEEERLPDSEPDLFAPAAEPSPHPSPRNGNPMPTREDEGLEDPVPARATGQLPESVLRDVTPAEVADAPFPNPLTNLDHRTEDLDTNAPLARTRAEDPLEQEVSLEEDGGIPGDGADGVETSFDDHALPLPEVEVEEEAPYQSSGQSEVEQIPSLPASSNAKEITVEEELPEQDAGAQDHIVSANDALPHVATILAPAVDEEPVPEEDDMQTTGKVGAVEVSPTVVKVPAAVVEDEQETEEEPILKPPRALVKGKGKRFSLPLPQVHEPEAAQTRTRKRKRFSLGDAPAIPSASKTPVNRRLSAFQHSGADTTPSPLSTSTLKRRLGINPANILPQSSSQTRTSGRRRVQTGNWWEIGQECGARTTKADIQKRKRDQDEDDAEIEREERVKKRKLEQRRTANGSEKKAAGSSLKAMASKPSGQPLAKRKPPQRPAVSEEEDSDSDRPRPSPPKHPNFALSLSHRKRPPPPSKHLSHSDDDSSPPPSPVKSISTKTTSAKTQLSQLKTISSKPKTIFTAPPLKSQNSHSARKPPIRRTSRQTGASSSGESSSSKDLLDLAEKKRTHIKVLKHSRPSTSRGQEDQESESGNETDLMDLLSAQRKTSGHDNSKESESESEERQPELSIDGVIQSAHAFARGKAKRGTVILPRGSGPGRGAARGGRKVAPMPRRPIALR